MVRKPPMQYAPDADASATLPSPNPAPASATAPAPAAAPKGKVVKVLVSAATSFSCLNPGEVILCEDVEDAAQLIAAGYTKASDEEPTRKMPSTAALAAKEAKARQRSGDEVHVLQGYDPDIHDASVQTARNQREQEDKASKPAARKRSKV